MDFFIFFTDFSFKLHFIYLSLFTLVNFLNEGFSRYVIIMEFIQNGFPSPFDRNYSIIL